MLLSSIKKAKKDREQRESGIPPPWRGLHAAPEEVKKLFMEPEMKEINGILDTASAIETLLETLPPGTKIYETLTLRDIKKNGPKKGKPKVRVVVKKGPEDVESHSPTIQMSTLRLLLALAAAKKAKVKGGDFPQAYLNAEQEVYYVYPPKTSRQYDEQGRRIVWALPKALYGGRASGRHWYFTLRQHLLADGFIVSEWDPCLFIKTDEDGNFHYIGVYVDDLIHVYSDETAYQATVDKFAKVFHGYSDLGTLCSNVLHYSLVQPPLKVNKRNRQARVVQAARPPTMRPAQSALTRPPPSRNGRTTGCADGRHFGWGGRHEDPSIPCETSPRGEASYGHYSHPKLGYSHPRQASPPVLRKQATRPGACSTPPVLTRTGCPGACRLASPSHEDLSNRRSANEAGAMKAHSQSQSPVAGVRRARAGINVDRSRRSPQSHITNRHGSARTGGTSRTSPCPTASSSSPPRSRQSGRTPA